MKIIDCNNSKSTRTYFDLFLQVQIQWFREEMLEKPDEISDTLAKGCTVIQNKVSGSIDHEFMLIGKDYYGNSYCKTVQLTQEEDRVVFRVNNQAYKVNSETYIVRRIAQDGLSYYVLQSDGVYILMDAAKLEEYSLTDFMCSVYEFNTIFPTQNNGYPIFSYPVNKGITEYVPSPDVLIQDDNSRYWIHTEDGIITCNAQPPKVNEIIDDSQAIEYINGVKMSTGIVAVQRELAAPSLNNFDFPKFSPSKIPYIAIPTTSSAPESYNLLPKDIHGILPNEEVYENYKLTIDSFNNQWTPDIISATTDSKAETFSSWYGAALGINSAWVTLPQANEPDNLGVADYVGNNDQTVPALTANVVGYTPEYRLFNAKFTSYHSKKVLGENDSNSGYFKLVKVKSGKKNFAVVDGGTVNKDGTKSGKSLIVIKNQDQAHQLWVEYNGGYSSSHFDIDDNCVVVVVVSWIPGTSVKDIEVSLETYDSIEGVPVDTIEDRCTIIGRVKNKKLYQDHIGTIYLDYTPDSVYNGGFALKLDPNTGNPYVTGGTIRVINRSYSVPRTSISSPGVVYIKVTINTSGNVTPTIESSDALPSDTDTASHYIIGTVKETSSGYKLTQDHHGGTPLFLFFSTDCIDSNDPNNPSGT